MVETLIVRLVRACCCYPALTVIVASLITLGAGTYSYENFAIHTDTGQLISSQLPWRQRELQFDAAFPQLADNILVVVDGATPELAQGWLKPFGRQARRGSRQLRSNAGRRGRRILQEEWAPVFAARRRAPHDRTTHPRPTVLGHAHRRSELARTRGSARFDPKGRGGGFDRAQELRQAPYGPVEHHRYAPAGSPRRVLLDRIDDGKGPRQVGASPLHSCEAKAGLRSAATGRRSLRQDPQHRREPWAHTRQRRQGSAHRACRHGR